MAQSQLALYNLALSIVGSKYTVEAVDEESVPAELCNLWYENVRQVTLRAAHWNSTKRYARLTEEAERDTSVDWVAADPEPGWQWSFVLPDDMLAARYLSDFSAFSLSTDNDKRIISANVETPVLVYTVDLDDPASWEPDLYQAIAYVLAAHITMPTTGKIGRVERNLEFARQLVNEARANTANEIQLKLAQQAASLAARGYSSTPPIPFIQPYGSFYSSGIPVT